MGHTMEADFADDETTPRSLREVEAESVALFVANLWVLTGQSLAGVTPKIGSAVEVVLMPKR